jgi:hypothetical protein
MPVFNKGSEEDVLLVVLGDELVGAAADEAGEELKGYWGGRGGGELLTGAPVMPTVCAPTACKPKAPSPQADIKNKIVFAFFIKNPNLLPL